jgi:hypothetical protein
MTDSKDLALVDSSISMLNNLKLSIQTPDDAVRAMELSQRLMRIAKVIEENVRKRTADIMYNEDLKSIENDSVEVRHVDPTEIDVYSARSVLLALGIDRAEPFLQVKAGEFKKYARRATANGEMTMGELEQCLINKTISRKKGFIKITSKL